MIDVDGAGIPGAPFIVVGNYFVGECNNLTCVDGTMRYNCSKLNISPDSIVDRKGENSPAATRVSITSCP